MCHSSTLSTISSQLIFYTSIQNILLNQQKNTSILQQHFLIMLTQLIEIIYGCLIRGYPQQKQKMYNMYQYRNQKIKECQEKRTQQTYQSFLSNREKYKQKSQMHRSQRLEDFLQHQNNSTQPHIIPDQYMTHKQADPFAQSNQLSFDQSQRLLPERPQYSSRNRLLSKKDSQFSLFGTTKLSKFTDKGQLPPNKMDQFRVTRQDMAYLSHSMPLKEKNRKKVSDSAMNFKQRANKVLRGFEDNKRRWEKAMIITKDRYRLCQPTHFDQSKIERAEVSAPLKLNRYPSHVENVEEEDFDHMSKVYFSEIGENRRKSKTFFKLAKTAQLFQTGIKKTQLDEVLNRSHYDRVKSRRGQSQSKLSKTFRTPRGEPISLA